MQRACIWYLHLHTICWKQVIQKQQVHQTIQNHAYCVYYNTYSVHETFKSFYKYNFIFNLSKVLTLHIVKYERK